MEEDYGDSTEDSSSSSESYESSEESSTQLETLRINGERLELPQGLCDNKRIFNEFFSQQTWQECFSEEQKQHLMNFLPSFPENDVQEKAETMQQLFSRESMRFGDVPMSSFYDKLNNGYFLPDISKMRSMMKRAMIRHCKEGQKRYFVKLTKEILISRQRLLERAYDQPVGTIPKMERIPQPIPPRIPMSEQKTKRRYYQELAAIRQEIGESDHSSEDENYPEGPLPRISKKQKRHLNSLELSLNPQMRPIFSSLSQKPSCFDLESNVTPTSNPYDMSEEVYRAELIRHKKRRNAREDHPDLNTLGITLQEVISRSQLGKKQSSTSKSSSPSDAKSSKKTKKLETVAKPPTVASPSVPQSQTASPQVATTHESSASDLGESEEDEMAAMMLEDLEFLNIGEEVTTTLTTTPVKTTSPRKRSSLATPTIKPSGKLLAAKKIKLEPDDVECNMDFKSAADSLYETSIVHAPVSFGGRQMTAATLSDLDGIDMMNLPVDLDDSSHEPINLNSLDDIKPTPELMQETHACFFSLIRDVICSTPEHRMNIITIEDRLRGWQENPISPLNDWYSLTNDWMVLLPSAVMFLCGDYPDVQPEDYVPYVDFKPQLQAYQWIGAGRDSDQHLQPLCHHWLLHRDEMELRLVKQDAEDGTEVDSQPEERNLSPPPPRFPTAWTVRPTTDEEKEVFREQEALRYENPHRSFTFRMHSYESIVGPVKGIYNQSSGATKPRGHSLLVTERPNFVTILCLVRDATARLPNGEGTRSDICELLKDSQYLAEIQQESYLHSVVSGALDRLHYETDPCVKYDTKRKIWIYLHRGRTEEEFERLHQQQQGMAKTKKPASSRKPARSKKEMQLSTVVSTPSKEFGSLSSIANTPPQPQTEVTISASPVPSAPLPFTPAARPSTPLVPHQPTVSTPPPSASPVTQPIPVVKSAQMKPATVKPLQNTKVQSKPAQTKVAPGAKPQNKVAATKPVQVKSPQTKSPQVKSPQAKPQTKSPRGPRAPAGSRTLQVSTSSGVQTIQVNTSAALLSGGVATGKSILSPMNASLQLPVSSSPVMKTVTLAAQSQTATPTSTTIKTVMLSQEQMMAARNAAVSLREITGKTSQKVVSGTLPTTQTVRMPISVSGTMVGNITGTVTTATMAQPKTIMTNRSQNVTGMPNKANAVIVPNSVQKGQQHTKPAILQQKVPGSNVPVPRITTPVQASSNTAIAQKITTTQVLNVTQMVNLPKPVVTMAGKSVMTTTQGVKVVNCAKPVCSVEATGTQQPTPNVKQRQQKQGQQFVQAATLLQQQQQQQQQQHLQQQQIQLQQQAKAAAIAQIQQQLKQHQQQQQTSRVASPNSVQQQQQVQRLVTTTMSVLAAGQGRVVTRVAGVQAATSTVPAAGKTQSPIMAKVVTNLQGQVISMESLLAHQKQHGTLPQGTALRVSTAGGKPGQTSLIQIPSSTPGGAPQYAVVSQGNILSVGQSRVLHTQLASQQPAQISTLNTAPQTVTLNQSQATKLVNAATGKPIVANAGNIRMIATTGATNTSNLRMLSATTSSPNIRMSAATAANLRMLNPGSGLNLATISGKPVLLASKGQATASGVGQNVILSQGGQGQTVMLAPQAIRGQTTGAHLVLQQGGTQQILLPPGFQGGTLNIKTLQGLQGLQGLKVIPISQTTGGKGRQQVYARIISPAVRPPGVTNLVQQQTTAAPAQQNTLSPGTSTANQATPKTTTKQ